METENLTIPQIRQVYYDLYANLPVLNIRVGALGYATDRSILYRWSGTVWQALTSLAAGFTQLGDIGIILTVPQFTLGTVGGGGATAYGAGIDLTTGAAANGRGFAYSRLFGLGSLFDIREIDWDKKLHIQFKIARTGSVAGTIARVQLKPNNNEADLAAKGIGIVINNYSIFAESYNTARLATDTTIVMGGFNYPNTIEIVHNPGVDVRWYVDKVLRVTHAVAANVPATRSPTVTNMLTFSIDNQPAGGASGFIFGGNVVIWQEN